MTFLATAAALAAAAAPAYATPDAAMKRAVRDAVPHGRTVGLRLACIGGGDIGERGTCEGSFFLRRGDRRALYVLTSRSRVHRTSAASVTARLDASRIGRVRGFPKRVRGSATLDGPPRPAERTVHGDLVLDRTDDFRDQTLSRRTRLAFPAPSWWRQAYGEGRVRLDGVLEHLYDVPPGGVCALEVGLSPRLAPDPPVERDGRLSGWSRHHEPGSDDDPTPVVALSDDGAGSLTWTLREGYTVRAGPAPPGIGPPGLDTLIVVASLTRELSRYGTPGPDGYPFLPIRRPQRDRCRALAERAQATVVPRALDAARLVPRARPPRPDPEDEARTPVDREY